MEFEMPWGTVKCRSPAEKHSSVSGGLEVALGWMWRLVILWHCCSNCVCVCVCADAYIHTYMWDFYGNYNIWLYIYEWRYIWLRKMRRSKTGLWVRSSRKGCSEKQELSEEAESAWADAWEKTQESRCHRAHGRQSSKAEGVVVSVKCHKEGKNIRD